MQLDLFEHSRDVTYRNAVIDALACRNASAAARAIGDLTAEYPADSMLSEFNLLCERLTVRVRAPLNRATVGEILRATEASIGGAQRVFGGEAESWLSPFWAELAAATTDLPFDARDEVLHAAPFYLRAGKWVDATTCIESIPSWRRQPAPLAWRIEATARMAGVDQIWPLLAELSWMAPHRAETLIEQLNMEELTKPVRRFHIEFDGENKVSEFAWFPAWVLIEHPQLADRFRAAQAGADTPAERCARLVLSLLALERQGRHDMLFDVRKKLRDTHGMLFERYMQSRPGFTFIR